MSTTTVGFVGVGIMGKPMAKNVLDAGYAVVAHNRSREPVDELVEAGAEAASSPKEVAERSDVVVTVLPDSDAVETVVLGEDGILDGAREGQTYVDMSTISPTVAERVAARLGEVGVSALDAPISGGEEGAIDGTLSIMVGGDADVLERHRDLLDAMGATVTHCGETGAGQIAKACNQIVVGVTYEAVSEALLLAHRAGADVEAVVDAISGGAAGCWVLDARAPRMIRGNFEPGFFASYQYKDLRIATDAGQAFGSPMPAAQLVHENYKAMEEKGYGRHDHSGVIQILEEMVDDRARIEE
jgi:2-hydroxy-3-oxopropionate reductase